MSKVIPATSQDVRAYFTSNPKKVPAGAEKSVQKSCKGRVAVSAIEAFNSDKSHGMRYVEGQGAHVALTYKARNHREVTVHLPRTQVRALAGKTGARGPLSKRDMDAAAQAYASQK